jgi:hypothetical protein
MLASWAIGHWRFPLFKMAIFNVSRMSPSTSWWQKLFAARTFCIVAKTDIRAGDASAAQVRVRLEDY